MTRKEKIIKLNEIRTDLIELKKLQLIMKRDKEIEERFEPIVIGQQKRKSLSIFNKAA